MKLIALCAALVIPSSASALTFTLGVELDTGLTDVFGTVDVTENAGALDFVVTLDPNVVGPTADLHVLYFNLVDPVTSLGVGNTNAPLREYQIITNPRVSNGAGSSFDFGVFFGYGPLESGNLVLQRASFTLFADVPLTVDSLMESSFTSGAIETELATHVQGTTLTTGENAETIGAVVPEPSTGLLVLLGVTSIAARRHLGPARVGATRLGATGSARS